MPILRLNASENGLVLHGSPASARASLRRLANGDGPVVIMVHGFKYDPYSPAFDPHSTIFAMRARPDRTDDVLWPRHLGFGAGRPDEGLCIAFGWRARGNLWRAQRSACAAGQALADVIRDIRQAEPERPVHIITHSMGSEVAFEALSHLPAHSVDRLVCLTGASYRSRAEDALQRPAGRTVELFNIMSRENDLFDFLFERLMAPAVQGDRAMGVGVDAANAVNIQLDCPETLLRLATMGGHITAPTRRVCHWSGYTRAGAMAFYAHLMRARHATPLHILQRILPETTAPRWSRMRMPLRSSAPLPKFQKAA